MRWVPIPDGQSGNVRVVHRPLGIAVGDRVVWTHEPVQALEELRQGQWICWMSTTIDEIILHDRALALARGHVLVGGLGLGYFLSEALARAGVRRATVVESNADVVRLVWPHLPHDRARLVQADVFEFFQRAPTARYDLVYVDIWARVTPRNLPEISHLRALAEPHLAPGGQIWCWGQELLERPAAGPSPDR